MFGDQDTGGERFRRVAVFHGNHRLQNNGAGVVMLVHEMHCAAGHFRAVFQHGLMDANAVHALAAEGRQQGGMDIHHTPCIGCYYSIGDFSHIPG